MDAEESLIAPRTLYLIRLTFYLKRYFILGRMKINLKIPSKKSFISVTEKTVF